MEEAVAVVTEMLQVDYGRILEVKSDGSGLVLRAGIGPEGRLEPGVSVPLGTEERFSDALLRND